MKPDEDHIRSPKYASMHKFAEISVRGNQCAASH